jgi:hypothetical protein
MVGIGIRTGACSTVEIMLAGVVDQVAKLLFPAGEEGRVVHGHLQLIGPAVAGGDSPGELGGVPAHPLDAFRAGTRCGTSGSGAEAGSEMYRRISVA